MDHARGIEVRPARRSDRRPLAEFLTRRPQGPPGSDAPDTLSSAEVHSLAVAVDGETVVGACHFHHGSGRCAVVLPPRMIAWDVPLAAELIRAATAAAHLRDGAKLIQSLCEPEGTSLLSEAVRLAGFERLAVLAYQRRAVRADEAGLPLPADIEWLHYRRLRQGKFARTITATYQDSLDCPGLAGLRTVDETITTHKHTGIFCPRAWHLAVKGGRPAGVALVNNLRGAGELVYLGVVPEARRQGVGRALLAQAVRDTAAMGLPQIGLAVDLGNAPAVRLYEEWGFREVRRRLAYFMPQAGLDMLRL
jgi:mycothiol synthase